jgi:hypothetical protein
MDAGTLATGWNCREQGLTVRTDVDALADLHLAALGAWLDALEARLSSS